jgi:Uma2 family endonuclease
VRRGRYRRRRPQAPDVLLVIEVADTSLDYDLGTKQQIYAAAGVKEYWVVDVTAERVAVFRNPSKHGYRKHEEYSSGQRISPAAAPRAVLDLDELFEG